MSMRKSEDYVNRNEHGNVVKQYIHKELNEDLSMCHVPSLEKCELDESSYSDSDTFSSKFSLSDESSTLESREVLLEKRGNQQFGFALQTFEVVHRRGGRHNINYIDHVEQGSAAALAGLLPGDVIIAINEFQVENLSHNLLLRHIQTAGRCMRITVAFRDCSRQVELRRRLIKLQRLLRAKLTQLFELENEEKDLANRAACRLLNSSSSAVTEMQDTHF